MLVSDLIVAMTKRKKEIRHQRIEDNPKKFIRERGEGWCLLVHYTS